MTRIAVIGPGAIGGTIAAWLAQNASYDVTLCARSPLERLEIDAPTGKITATPRVITDPDRGETVDWALVTTKTYDAEGAARWFKGLVGRQTRVAIIQNGVEHIERFAPYVDRARILPAMVDIPAERSAPGRVLQRRNGIIVVPKSADGEAFASLFAHTPIEASQSDDFVSVLWWKLCVNCAGAVSGVTMKPNGVARIPEIAAIMRELVRECVLVGRAEGATLADDLPETITSGYAAAPPESINSLFADRLAGNPMEVDARNGVIVRRGEKHGIPTPMNRTIVALLNATR